MKKLILVLVLLIAIPSFAEDAPKEPTRVKLTIDGDTASLCYSLMNQVNLSGSDPKLLEAAAKISEAKADIEKAIKQTKK